MGNKNAIEREKNRLESDIRYLNGRVNTLEGNLSQVCKERDEIKTQLKYQTEVEKRLRLRLTEVEKEVTVISEKERKIKVDNDELLEEKASIERKMDLILREKDSIERSMIESNGLVDKLRNDIFEISKENMVIEGERNMLEKTNTELKNSVDELNELVHKLQIGEEELLQKVENLEKICVVSSENVAKMSIEIDRLVKENQEIEETVRKVAEEALKVVEHQKLTIDQMSIEIDRLVKENQEIEETVRKVAEEALKVVEHHKLTIDQMVIEKNKINDAKNQVETNILKLENQLDDFKNTVSTLENSIILQTETIKQLESEVSCQKAAFDQATKERNNALANLDGEKLKVQNLSERISNMEKDTDELVDQKKELETAHAVLEDDILVMKKSIAEIQKENDDLKTQVRVFEANMGRILKILKTTTMICNSTQDDDMGIDQEIEIGEEIRDHVKEVEAIKEAFKEKESIIDDFKITVSTLENSIILQTETIKQLESEVSCQKAAFDKATKERNNALANLDGEKLKVQNLSERISNMEKDTDELVDQKKELETSYAVLEDDIIVMKKSIAEIQKENDDLKTQVRVFEANMGRILKILKTTSMICNSAQDDDMGIDQEIEIGEEIKDHVKEVEAIKEAFKEKESIIDEMKKKLELLQDYVAKAKKRKSFLSTCCKRM